MLNKVKEPLGFVGLLIFILFFLAIGPFLFLWSVNTLSEVAGLRFYIPHTIESYLSSLVLLMMIRGGSD